MPQRRWRGSGRRPVGLSPTGEGSTGRGRFFGAFLVVASLVSALLFLDRLLDDVGEGNVLVVLRLGRTDLLAARKRQLVLVAEELLAIEEIRAVAGLGQRSGVQS